MNRPEAVRLDERTRRRERWKSAALTTLVLLGLALSYDMWMRMPGGGPPPEPRPYLFSAEMESDLSPRRTLFPRRIVIHEVGDHGILLDPNAEAFIALAEAAGVILSTTGETAAPAPVPYEEVAAERRRSRGFELIMPAGVVLDQFLAAAGSGKPLPGPGGEVSPVWTQVLIRPGIDAEGNGRATVFLGDGSGWWRLEAAETPELTAFLERVGAPDLVALLERAAAEAPPAEELTGETLQSLAVAPGLYAPAYRREDILRQAEETIDADAVVASFFADSGILRQIRSMDGSLLKTDGMRGLVLGPDGSIRFETPGVGVRREKPLVDVLRGVTDFVGRHGGWFPGSGLLSLQRDARDDLLLDFVPVYEGKPVLILGGSDSSWAGEPWNAPISLRVAADGEVKVYQRWFRPVGQKRGQTVILPAGVALGILDGALAGAGAPAEPVTVRDVFPAYAAESAPARSAGAFRLVWAVVLGDGGRAAIDAVTGEVFPPDTADGKAGM